MSRVDKISKSSKSNPCNDGSLTVFEEHSGRPVKLALRLRGEDEADGIVQDGSMFK